MASGKSEVTRRFQALGVEVVDADVAAREVVEPGQPALARIAERFGAGMLLADGRLDRRQLRERVFADAQARRDLEAITHPAIRQKVQGGVNRAKRVRFLTIPVTAEADEAGRASTFEHEHGKLFAEAAIRLMNRQPVGNQQDALALEFVVRDSCGAKAPARPLATQAQAS